MVEVELNISVGQIFKSFKGLDEALKTTCEQHFVQYYKRDSRTIEAASRRNTNKKYSANLVYAEVKFTCIHGGKKFKTEGKGLKRSSTIRKDCPAYIKAVATEEGLRIQNVCHTHNHPVEKALYQLLPHNKTLAPRLKNDAKKLMRLKVNKKLIGKKLDETNTHLTLRDITNLGSKDRQLQINDLEAVVDKLVKCGANVDILIEERNFKGLFFCTPKMKQNMKAYPELLCIDATFLLSNVGASVYIVLVEDGNGESLIVAVGILVTDDAESLGWFLKTFKATNDSWTQVRNILANKEWNQGEILKTEFPDAKVLVCIFHLYRIFQRTISWHKMNITGKDRTLALNILEQIVCSRSEAESEDIKKLVEQILPQEAKDYFNSNWEPIKSERCLFLGDTFSDFLNTTNNRLESLNSDLDEVIHKYSTVEQFVDGLFAHLQSSEFELDVSSSNLIQKLPVASQKLKLYEQEYLNFLTDYAFKKLETQFNFSAVKFSQIQPNSYQVESSSCGFLTTSSSNCTCIFFKSMSLPCKHIFAIRNHEKLLLFEPFLCKERWSLNYYKLNHALLKDHHVNEMEGNNCNCHITNFNLSASQPRIPSKQEKYNKALIKCKLLASLAAEECGLQFESRIEELDNLIAMWKRDDQSGNEAPRNCEIPSETDSCGDDLEIPSTDSLDYSVQENNAIEVNENQDEAPRTRGRPPGPSRGTGETRAQAALRRQENENVPEGLQPEQPPPRRGGRPPLSDEARAQAAQRRKQQDRDNHRVRREDPEQRKQMLQRDNRARRKRLEDPDYRQQVLQRDNDARRVRRENPEYRHDQQARDEATRAAAWTQFNRKIQQGPTHATQNTSRVSPRYILPKDNVSTYNPVDVSSTHATAQSDIAVIDRYKVKLSDGGYTQYFNKRTKGLKNSTPKAIAPSKKRKVNTSTEEPIPAFDVIDSHQTELQEPGPSTTAWIAPQLLMATHEWSVHILKEKVAVVHINENIQMDKIVTFSKGVAPEFRCHGRVVAEIDDRPIPIPSTIKEVNRLLKVIDQLKVCAGTGSKLEPYSAVCSGVTKGKRIRCLACQAERGR